jgi:hypothetical protein
LIFGAAGGGIMAKQLGIDAEGEQVIGPEARIHTLHVVKSVDE